MRKKIYATILAGVLVLAQVATVFAGAGRPVYIALDGFLQNLNHEAFVVDGRTLIDAEDAVAIFGDAVLRANVVEIDGRDMLTIRDVASFASLNVIWDDEKGLVSLSSANPSFSLLSQAASAQPTVSMTFQNALTLVNERDTRLISMEENKIIVEREERQINDILSDRNIRGRSQRNYTRLEVELLRMREGMSIQIQALDINENLIRAGNEVQLRNALADVARSELDIALIERQLSVEERSFVIVELMHELGMESDSGLRDAQTSLERTRTNLESAHTSLNNNRIALNTLLGLASSAIVEIQGLSWTIAARTPLEGHIQTQLSNAPTLALLQLELDMAEYMFWSYDFLMILSHQADDYRYRGRREDATVVIEMQNAISDAERAMDNGKINLENRIRSLHNDITTLLEQQTITQNDLANAIDDYQDTMVLYMAGVATWLELERAKLAILNHEVALARHEINLGMLTLMYQRPYLGQ